MGAPAWLHFGSKSMKSLRTLLGKGVMNNRAPILVDILDLLYERYVTGAIMAIQIKNNGESLYFFLKMHPTIKITRRFNLLLSIVT